MSKRLIASHKGNWSDTEMHYAYWLAFNGKRLAKLASSKETPEPDHFKVTYSEKKRVRNYLRRIVRRKRGDRPFARLKRSVVLDTDMYSVVENPRPDRKPLQIIKIMGLRKGDRIAIPLTGYTTINGTIRVVLDFCRHRIEIHTTNAVQLAAIPPEDTVIALEAGCTEVFTDEGGAAYEPEFGKTLLKASERLNKTGKARNKAHALAKISSKHKSHRIRKFNLGKNKMRDRKRKGKIRVRQMISQAIHQVVKTKKPNTIITENLNIRGKAKSKKMSRLVSYWMRGALKERLSFLALVEGFHHKQVNPAYTSQMCPTCFFVHKDNRTGDIFQCLNCGYRDHADRVAAKNLRARFDDHEIAIYTPRSVVLSILQRRFSASLQSSKPTVGVSVSGRTGVHSSVRQRETPSPKQSIANGRGTEISSVYI